MQLTVDAKDLARYLGSRYKNAHRLAKMFSDMCGDVPNRTPLQSHYLDVALNYMNQAAMWREAIRHWKSGDLATWH